MTLQHLLTRFWPNFKVYCSAWPRLKMTTKIGLHTITTHPHHPPHKLLDSNISCYWPNFDQTLDIGPWEHLQQIPAVTVTFFQATFVLAILVHISNISATTFQAEHFRLQSCFTFYLNHSFPHFCHTRLHLGFLVKLWIWQVSGCKMEPRSGMII